MFILSFFADLLSKKSFSGLISEPLAVLLFGIALFTITAGLRSFLNKQDKNTKKILGEMEKDLLSTTIG